MNLNWKNMGSLPVPRLVELRSPPRQKTDLFLPPPPFPTAKKTPKGPRLHSPKQRQTFPNSVTRASVAGVESPFVVWPLFSSFTWPSSSFPLLLQLQFLLLRPPLSSSDVAREPFHFNIPKGDLAQFSDFVCEKCREKESLSQGKLHQFSDVQVSLACSIGHYDRVSE